MTAGHPTQKPKEHQLEKTCPPATGVARDREAHANREHERAEHPLRALLRRGGRHASVPAALLKRPRAFAVRGGASARARAPDVLRHAAFGGPSFGPHAAPGASAVS